ncbi:hypothetical protein IKJ53_07805 [bacterium]|nr:hypothetical protein [bacterium]
MLQPPSLLFISEFLMIKTMITEKQYVLCGVFAVLLTIILYGLAKSAIKMSFGLPNENKLETYKTNTQKLSLGMYIPQIVMLTATFILGVFLPDFIDNLIRATVVGLGG